MLTSKGMRSILLSQFRSYFDAKKIDSMPKNLAFKKAFDARTPKTALKDIYLRAHFLEEEKPHMIDILKEAISNILKLEQNFNESKLLKIYNSLASYTNYDEKEILGRLRILCKKYVLLNSPKEKKKLLIELDDYVRNLKEDEKNELSYELESFMNKYLILALYFTEEHEGEDCCCELYVDYGKDKGIDEKIDKSIESTLSKLDLMLASKA